MDALQVAPMEEELALRQQEMLAMQIQASEEEERKDNKGANESGGEGGGVVIKEKKNIRVTKHDRKRHGPQRPSTEPTEETDKPSKIRKLSKLDCLKLKARERDIKIILEVESWSEIETLSFCRSHFELPAKVIEGVSAKISAHMKKKDIDVSLYSVSKALVTGGNRAFMFVNRSGRPCQSIQRSLQSLAKALRLAKTDKWYASLISLVTDTFLRSLETERARPFSMHAHLHFQSAEFSSDYGGWLGVAFSTLSARVKDSNRKVQRMAHCIRAQRPLSINLESDVAGFTRSYEVVYAKLSCESRRGQALDTDETDLLQLLEDLDAKYAHVFRNLHRLKHSLIPTV